MRLLIIEDNIELCKYMRDGLSNAVFTIDTVYTGNDGEEKAYVNPYDAILLDLNLADKDDIHILKFLRKEQIETPVIIVTARDAC